MVLITLTVMVSAVVWMVLRTDLGADNKSPSLTPVRIRDEEEERRRRLRRDQ